LAQGSMKWADLLLGCLGQHIQFKPS